MVGRVVASLFILCLVQAAPIVKQHNSDNLAATQQGPTSSLRFVRSNDGQILDDKGEGSISTADNTMEAPTGASAMNPFVMEFSVLICFGKNGCGKSTSNSNSSAEVEQFFGEEGDWPAEKKDEYYWQAASPRVTSIKNNEPPPADGGDRVPSGLPSTQISELTEYLSEELGVSSDLIYTRKPSQSTNHDDGRLRLPFAIWLDSEAEVRRTASIVRRLQTDPEDMLKALGVEAPREAPGPWIEVDSWCPAPHVTANTDGSTALTGCQKLDTSTIEDIANAIRAVGPFHPQLIEGITHYPDLFDAGESLKKPTFSGKMDDAAKPYDPNEPSEPTKASDPSKQDSIRGAYSGVVHAKDQQAEADSTPYKYSSFVMPIQTRDKS